MTNSLTLAYDGSGNLASVTTPGGRQLTLTSPGGSSPGRQGETATPRNQCGERKYTKHARESMADPKRERTEDEVEEAIRRGQAAGQVRQGRAEVATGEWVADPEKREVFDAGSRTLVVRGTSDGRVMNVDPRDVNPPYWTKTRQP